MFFIFSAGIDLKMGYFLPTVFLFINCASFAFSAGGTYTTSFIVSFLMTVFNENFCGNDGTEFYLNTNHVFFKQQIHR